MYTATTRDITVRVQPQFLAEQSDPGSDQYFWLYTIHIENGGAETVQLLNREGADRAFQRLRHHRRLGDA